MTSLDHKLARLSPDQRRLVERRLCEQPTPEGSPLSFAQLVQRIKAMPAAERHAPPAHQEGST
jgi:hypothetical protein